MRNIWSAFILAVWLIVSGYVGIGGYVKIDLEGQYEKAKESSYAPIKDSNGDEYFNVETYKVSLEEDRFRYLFPFVPYIPSIMAFLLTASCFGILGTLTKIFKSIAVDKTPLHEIVVISTPILGGLIGIVVLGISYLIPSILVQGEGQLRRESLIFICLFGGLFSDHFFNWLNSFANKIFPIKEDEKKSATKDYS